MESDWPTEILGRLGRLRSSRVVTAAMDVAETSSLSDRCRARAVEAICESLSAVSCARDGTDVFVVRIGRIICTSGGVWIEPPARDAADPPTLKALDLPRLRGVIRKIEFSTQPPGKDEGAGLDRSIWTTVGALRRELERIDPR